MRMFSAKAKANCRKKAWYPREAVARVIGQDSLARHGDAGQLFPYQCGVCRRWHLTKCAQPGQTPITKDRAYAFGEIAR